MNTRRPTEHKGSTRAAGDDGTDSEEAEGCEPKPCYSGSYGPTSVTREDR